MRRSWIKRGAFRVSLSRDRLPVPCAEIGPFTVILPISLFYQQAQSHACRTLPYGSCRFWPAFLRLYFDSSGKVNLRGNSNGSVDKTTNRNHWEQWTVVKLPDSKYIIRSYHNNYLCGGDTGVLSLQGAVNDWEKWTIVLNKNGAYTFTSYHGITYSFYICDF